MKKIKLILAKLMPASRRKSFDGAHGRSMCGIVLIALLTAALTAASLSGCKKGPKIQSVLDDDGITSVAVDGQGTVYILSDRGLRSYALSGDKRMEYVFDREDVAEAEFKWVDSGEELTYSSFKPERIIASGETGLQFLGRYMTNDAGRDSDLFVVQDIIDMNYSAAYFNEIQRDYKSSAPIVNGVGVTENGIYLKLNRPYAKRPRLDGGVDFWYDGYILPYDVPDGVIGATGKAENDQEEVWFLTEDKAGYKILDGEKNVLAEYAAADAAGAFSDQKSFYVIYRDGKVTRWTPDGGEEDFASLGVKIEEAREPFIWDGQIYWLDGGGLKTVEIK